MCFWDGWNRQTVRVFNIPFGKHLEKSIPTIYRIMTTVLTDRSAARLVQHDANLLVAAHFLQSEGYGSSAPSEQADDLLVRHALGRRAIDLIDKLSTVTRKKCWLVEKSTAQRKPQNKTRPLTETRKSPSRMPGWPRAGGAVAAWMRQRPSDEATWTPREPCSLRVRVTWKGAEFRRRGGA